LGPHFLFFHFFLSETLVDCSVVAWLGRDVSQETNTICVGWQFFFTWLLVAHI
jgi:hypothetical protein